MTARQAPAHPAHAALLAMPHDRLQQTAILLYDAFVAATEETRHVQQVLGCWAECPDCVTAFICGDHRRCCQESRLRQERISAGWRLR